MQLLRGLAGVILGESKGATWEASPGFTRCLFLESLTPSGISEQHRTCGVIRPVIMDDRTRGELPRSGLRSAPSQVQSLVALGTWCLRDVYLCVTKS